MDQVTDGQTDRMPLQMSKKFSSLCAFSKGHKHRSLHFALLGKTRFARSLIAPFKGSLTHFPLSVMGLFEFMNIYVRAVNAIKTGMITIVVVTRNTPSDLSHHD